MKMGVVGGGEFRLERCGVAGGALAKLGAAGVRTAGELLQLAATRVDVLEAGLLPAEGAAAVAAAARAVAPPRRTALDLARGAQLRGRLPTGLPAVDAALRGGVPAGSITEVVGPAGLGKTQLCLTLSVAATRAVDAGGLGGAVAYFDTENKFSSARLLQIARARFPGQYEAPEAAESLATRVLIFTPYAQGGHGGGDGASAALLRLLESLERHIVARGIRFIVVDSIASLMRAESADTLEARMRLQDILGRQAAVLKRYAEDFALPVLAVNQVTTRVGGGPAHSLGGSRPRHGSNDEADGRRERELDRESYLTAALGYKWAHAVNTRLLVEADGGGRVLSIAKSPLAPNASAPYAVDARGIVPAAEFAPTAIQQGSAAHRRLAVSGQVGAGGVALAPRDDAMPEPGSSETQPYTTGIMQG